MTRPLLPSNTTELERHAAQALAQIERIPVPIRTLIDANECPVRLLPYLAWAVSVDRWEESWPEQVKRQVIRSAWFVHAHKGTIGALRRVADSLGYVLRVREWWEEIPPAQPGTFQIDIGVLSSGITEETYESLVLFIDDAKPVSRHLTSLTISLETRGSVFLAAALTDGEILTVYPLEPGPIEISSSALRLDGAIHHIDTLSVYP